MKRLNSEVDWHNDKEIKNLVFTEEFLNKEISFTTIFQDILGLVNTEAIQTYENGRILTCKIQPISYNSIEISKVIKDLEAFYLYQKAVTDNDKPEINIAVITEFMAYNGLGYIKLDREKNILYNHHNCIDF